MNNIRGIEINSEGEVRQAINSGGRFVIYTIRVAGVFGNQPKHSKVYFVRKGESHWLRDIGYGLLLLLSRQYYSSDWLSAVGENFNGGKDITEEVLDRLFGQLYSDRIADQLNIANEDRGIPIGRVRCRKCGIDYWEEADKCWRCGAPQAWGS